MDKAAAQPGARKAVWVRQAPRDDAPPLGPGYAEYVAGRVKEALVKMKGEGKLEGEQASMEWY